MEKLIRDLIPDVAPEMATRRAGDDEYVPALLDKLVEEAAEARSSLDDDHLLEELADVYEVMLALLAEREWSMAQLETAAAEKRGRGGAFELRLIGEIS